MRINSAKELKVYQEAYSLAMEIFEISKQFKSDGHLAQYVQICVRPGRREGIKHILSAN